MLVAVACHALAWQSRSLATSTQDSAHKADHAVRAPALWTDILDADTDGLVVFQLVGMDIQNRDFIALKWDDGRRSNFHLLHLRSWCLCPECQHSTGQRLVNAADIAPSQDIDDIYRTSYLTPPHVVIVLI